MHSQFAASSAPQPFTGVSQAPAQSQPQGAPFGNLRAGAMQAVGAQGQQHGGMAPGRYYIRTFHGTLLGPGPKGELMHTAKPEVALITSLGEKDSFSIRFPDFENKAISFREDGIGLKPDVAAWETFTISPSATLGKWTIACPSRGKYLATDAKGAIKQAAPQKFVEFEAYEFLPALAHTFSISYPAHGGQVLSFHDKSTRLAPRVAAWETLVLSPTAGGKWTIVCGGRGKYLATGPKGDVKQSAPKKDVEYESFEFVPAPF